MNCRRRTPKLGEGEMISMTNMMDVLLILMSFFLVASSFKEEEVDHLVNLPVDARNQSLTQTTDSLMSINIRKDGSYIVLGKQITEERMSEWMTTEIAKKPDIKVLIRSDQDAKHLYLANVMSICRHVGVPKANIAVKTGL